LGGKEPGAGLTLVVSVHPFTTLNVTSHSTLRTVYTHTTFMHTFSTQFGGWHWWPVWVAPFFVLVLPVTQLCEETIQETMLVKKKPNQKMITWSVFHCASSLNCHCTAG